MTISNQSWNRYVERLSKLDRRAGEEMEAYIREMIDPDDPDEAGLISYANALVNKYGEGAAELAAQMYDEMAELAGVDCYPAEPAEVSTIEEITQSIHAAKKSAPLIKQAVSRMVKLAGADTTLKNAIRDGAQFAWIPGGGETCAFCITLASRGWQNISKKAMRRGHAEHIHANCDCNYTVRFDRETTVAGYDPDKYLEMYENAEGGTPEEKIASLRQNLNSQNREKINAQKRAAYATKKQRETGEAVREYKKISLNTSTKPNESDTMSIGIQFFASMPEEKFTEYALNAAKAPDKARAFKEALGYDVNNYKDLIENINNHIDETKFVPKNDAGYGMRYEYVVELKGPNGKTANVLTAWIQDGDDKRLTSVYVTNKKVTE